MRHHLLLIALASFVLPLHAADDSLPPDKSFPATRYQLLWTKSPFKVASAENGPTPSDYAMVGMAEIEGVSYVNLIDKQSGVHFLLASDTPSHGLSLVSVNRGKDAASTFAIVDRGGQSLHLQFEAVAAPLPGAGPAPVPMSPAANAPGPGVPAPGAVYQAPVAVLPNVSNGSPQARFHHRIVRIPPPPAQNTPPPNP